MRAYLLEFTYTWAFNLGAWTFNQAYNFLNGTLMDPMWND